MQTIKVMIMIKHEEEIEIDAEDLIDQTIDEFINDYVTDEMHIVDSMDYEVC